MPLTHNSQTADNEPTWGDVDKTFESFRQAYYDNTEASEPEEPPERFSDAPMQMRRFMAGHSVLGNPESDRFENGVVLPIVNPNTQNLNKSAVVSANAYAGRVEGLSQETIDAVKSYLSNLYQDNFGGDEEESNSLDVLNLDIDLKAKQLGMVDK